MKEEITILIRKRLNCKRCNTTGEDPKGGPCKNCGGIGNETVSTDMTLEELKSALDSIK